VPNIVSDDRAIGRMAADYLLRRGFRHFAYCGFGDLFYWSRDRGRSFCQAVREAGYEAHYYECERRVLASRSSWVREQAVLIDWLKSLPKPVGLMASNDDRSQYVVEACRIGGLHVPEQVAILGMGNDELICDLAMPRLSSIAVSSEKAGYEAAALLDKLMAGREVADHTVIGLPSHVVTRQSTTSLPSPIAMCGTRCASSTPAPITSWYRLMTSSRRLPCRAGVCTTVSPRRSGARCTRKSNVSGWTGWPACWPARICRLRKSPPNLAVRI